MGGLKRRGEWALDNGGFNAKPCGVNRLSCAIAATRETVSTSPNRWHHEPPGTDPMKTVTPTEGLRALSEEHLSADFVVVGGGLAGVCAAITAARQGLRVVLVQDRPVLGGNASSEVRLWALGATSHMGNNNRWAREGGVLDEIFVENTFRNPEGNPHLFDAVLLDKVAAEPGIRLLLNTAVFAVAKSDAETVASVRAYCSQNETFYDIDAPLFCDASGDGVVAFQSGAAFRLGSESRGEFGEKFAPEEATGELLGHTIFFYSKNVGKPVRFIPPSFALDDITKIPRFGQISSADSGCNFWWLEYGGLRDTIHESEEIKWELWRVVYGVWNHIKNSGQFPEAENLTLEWVGTIPGKRESRRFEGDAILVQQDIVEQRRHADAAGFGGWAIDLHPAAGVYSEKPPCTQWHSKGVYQIPFRCMYSRNITNLFLAGRIISVSHVAFGSTRVMASTGHNAQAVGMAAAMCREQNVRPRDLLEPSRMRELQARLHGMGHYIPHVAPAVPGDLAPLARASASSSYRLDGFQPCGESAALDCPRALLLPVEAGQAPKFSLRLDVEAPVTLTVELRGSEREGNFTPDVTLASTILDLEAGTNQTVAVDFDVPVDADRYVFLCLMAAAGVRVHLSNERVTGVLSLIHGANRKVAKSGVQIPNGDIGVDRVEFWIPERRPGGRNFAITIDPPVGNFRPESVQSGPSRPVSQPNAWVAAKQDPAPALTLTWPSPVFLRRVELTFDSDFDHAMESVQWGHPERAMPFCVKHYRLRDDQGRIVHEEPANHQTRNVIRFSEPVSTASLTVECVESHGDVPAAIFSIRCFGD